MTTNAPPRDPITTFCHLVMQRFVDVTARATPDSAFGRARAKLGERFDDVVMASMRRHVVATLTKHKDTVLRGLDATGEPGAAAVLVGIVGDVLADICREAGEQPLRHTYRVRFRDAEGCKRRLDVTAPSPSAARAAVEAEEPVTVLGIDDLGAG